MRLPQLGTIHKVVSWVLRGVAALLWMYASYSVYIGRVRVASRSTNVIIEFAASPLPFILAVLLYVGGGVLFLWMARGIASD